MGCHPNIGKNKFPKQASWLGKKVEVCFHYDTRNTERGVIVRDDGEDPNITIIQLESGKYILATECQFSLTKEET